MSRTHVPPIVGRAHEIATLEHSLNAARRHRGHALFLVGGRGVGKSRLAEEAAARGQALGMRVLWGRASAVGPPVALRPLAEALLGLLRSGGVPTHPRLEPYRRILGHLIPDWRHGEQVNDAESPVVLAEAVLRLVSTVGQDQGSLVILEDLHHADSRTLAAVEYLVDNLARQPVALLVTIRSGFGGVADLARVHDWGGIGALLHLDDLGRQEIRPLAAGYLRADPAVVPDRLADWPWDGTAGNPHLAEKAVEALCRAGLLAMADGVWHLADVPDDALTECAAERLADATADDARRIGPEGEAFLTAAAVFGARFPPAAVRAVAGMSEPALAQHLRSAVASQLLVRDERSSAWYTFRHPLTVRALLCRLTPAERAEIARRAAETMDGLRLEPPWEWARLTAALRCAGGDPSRAASLLAEAGRHAIEAGMPGTAVELLDQACDTDEPALAVAATALLVEALIDAGEVDRACRLAGILRDLDPAVPYRRELTELRVSLARAAVLAGRHVDGARHLAAARTLVGPDTPASITASLDALAARLVVYDANPGWREAATKLAREALAAAERHSAVTVVCRAEELLGMAAYDRGLEESTAHFDRLSKLARENNLVTWQLRARLRLGHNDWLAGGDDTRIRQARDDAARSGPTAVGRELDAHLALYRVLGGEFSVAAELIGRCLEDVSRSGLADAARLLLLAEAVRAAHLCDRPAMEHARAEFSGWGGGRSPLGSLMPGLAGVFCALLEEDRDRAQREMADIAAGYGLHPLAGHHGLRVLLDVLSEQETGHGRSAVAVPPASRFRWNQQFVLFARAVRFGRAGAARKAMLAMRLADDTAAPFPVARHLGLRLVAEAAYIDGWGEPEAWLRRAEEYFHGVSAPAVVAACRTLLRRAGVTVRQRRTGFDRIPPRLRRLGVTVREYEVLELLAHRLGNQAIATKLFISPRTVEKHVASLIAKTRQPDRVSLTLYALTTVGDAGRDGPADQAEPASVGLDV